MKTSFRPTGRSRIALDRMRSPLQFRKGHEKRPVLRKNPAGTDLGESSRDRIQRGQTSANPAGTDLGESLSSDASHQDSGEAENGAKGLSRVDALPEDEDSGASGDRPLQGADPAGANGDTEPTGTDPAFAVRGTDHANSTSLAEESRGRRSATSGECHLATARMRARMSLAAPAR